MTYASFDYPELELFIGGSWRKGTGRDREPVLNPATGEVLGEVPHANTEDVEAALVLAGQGFNTWRRMFPSERGCILREVAGRMLQRRDDIALLITLEMGKPLRESKVEVDRAAGILEWYAEEGKRAYGRLIPANGHSIRQMAIPEPVGPVGAFAPWNAPLVTSVRKIAGALAAGCSVVIKPSEETPATALAIARLFDEVGIPAGVLSMLFGVPMMLSEKIIGSPVIRGITFTGSTAMGKRVASMAMHNMQRVTMELGGHAPVLVFDDVNPEKIGEAAALAKYRNAGQICTAPTRFFVHKNIYERFVAAFIARARAIVIGDGRDPATEMGPLANARRVETLERLTEDARSRGIRIGAGGRVCGNRGYFYEPTVLVDMDDDCLAANLEPFGPLAGLAAFSSFDEVVERANRLPYALAAYVMTHDSVIAQAAVEALESGNVIVNHWTVSHPETPFGGHKESGMGSEGGIEGLQAFQNIKFVSLA